MLAAFELTGYRLDAHNKQKEGPAGATPQMSLKASLALFRQLVSFTAQNCLSEIDGQFFTASYAHGRRLSHVAVVQSMPCIKALPVVSTDLAPSIMHCIVRCKCKHISNMKL